jgi:hypothetical protein
MYTPEGVLRMQDQKDIDSLIQVLESDSDPLLRGLAAKILADLGGPKARDALERALKSGDPLVIAPASTALDQLKTKGVETGKKKTDALRRHRQKGLRGCLWSVPFVVGILLSLVGLMSPIMYFDDSTANFRDISILLAGGFEFFLGILLIYLSTRPVKPKDKTENENNLEI